MPDRENVIRALEICEKKDCALCPYTDWCAKYDDYYYDCTKLLAKDALELLKEQETVVRCRDCIYGEHEKNESTGMTWIYCGHHRENRPEDWFCASGSRI